MTVYGVASNHEKTSHFPSRLLCYYSFSSLSLSLMGNLALSLPSIHLPFLPPSLILPPLSSYWHLLLTTEEEEEEAQRLPLSLFACFLPQ